ncbi:DNA polymerase III epsilon subunit [Bradyrhizobium yuanmingense]
MREIVLDTETTGLDPLRGDRLVEIGCVEIFNRMPTGQTYHVYINPERDMPAEAFAVHGLSSEFLATKPLFHEVADDFLAFIGDAPLVIHNASFDIGFINAELDRIKRAAIPRERLVDTLLLARRKHPGVSNRLDDLCSRYSIDNSHRTKHGALLDAELLAEVYVDLVGARQSQLLLASDAEEIRVNSAGDAPRRPTPGAARAADFRSRARGPSGLHRNARRQGDLERVPARSRRAGGGSGLTGLSALSGHLPLHVLAVETDEVDRIQHQRREPAIAHRRRNDLACEREQQARALDHDQRVQVLLGHVDDPEHAGIGELEREHHFTGGLGLALDRQRHLEFLFTEIVGVDVDLDVDLRRLALRLQRARSVGIFEREVLGVLRQHVELGSLGRLGRGAVTVGHEVSPYPIGAEFRGGWLT